MKILSIRYCCNCLFLIMCMHGVISAQSSKDDLPVFGLGVVVGGNFAQIDGDNFVGYDQLGLIGGLQGKARLNAHFAVHVELLFSQKGSKFESEASARSDGDKDREIKLDYAEIPILFVYNTSPLTDRGRFRFEGGISVARLLKSTIIKPPVTSDQEFDFSAVKDEFKSTDLNIVIGAHYDFLERFGIGLRYSGAVTKFYEDPTPTPPVGNKESVAFLRNYLLSFMLSYHF